MNPETRVFVIDGADSEDFVTLACIVLIQCQGMSHLRQLRQGICIASSYADAL